MKLFNGEETLEFEKEKQTVFVKLEKTQVQLSELEEICEFTVRALDFVITHQDYPVDAAKKIGWSTDIWDLSGVTPLLKSFNDK